MAIKIPQKSSFKLEEICKLTSVKPYILRLWESEFEEISPMTTSSGKKMYGHKDIELILKLKDCLLEKKMTVGQTKAWLLNPKKFSKKRSFKRNEKENSPSPSAQKLVLAKAKLQSMISKTKSIKDFHHWA